MSLQIDKSSENVARGKNQSSHGNQNSSRGQNYRHRGRGGYNNRQFNQNKNGPNQQRDKNLKKSNDFCPNPRQTRGNWRPSNEKNRFDSAPYSDSRRRSKY